MWLIANTRIRYPMKAAARLKEWEICFLMLDDRHHITPNDASAALVLAVQAGPAQLQLVHQLIHKYYSTSSTGHPPELCMKMGSGHFLMLSLHWQQQQQQQHIRHLRHLRSAARKLAGISRSHVSSASRSKLCLLSGIGLCQHRAAASRVNINVP
jgi:hypothetical protein